MIAIMRSDYTSLFDAESVTNLRLAEGAPLFHADDPVTQIVLVREGTIHLLRRTTSGTTVILQAARAGDVVAEASAYSSAYHCGAEAARASRVTLLPVARFRAALAADPALADSWAAHLARSVQAARMRAEIRTLHTVAERLDTWLTEGQALPDKGHWQDLAAELGVTREALYRELARRRQSGRRGPET
ncbi:MAG: Crp/Fnr family transcriptional regulator [Pseudorhodobacter sp.]|nr:Crp/Fnr family transcriptional regulator [Pseudorhodobacter sp.]